MKTFLAKLGIYLVKKYADMNINDLIKEAYGFPKGYAKINLMEGEERKQLLSEASQLVDNKVLHLITEYAIIEQRDETFVNDNADLATGKAAIYGVTRPIALLRQLANEYDSLIEDKSFDPYMHIDN